MYLAPGGRQAVRALDPVHVAVLERGQHPLPHITERPEQLSPVAQLLTPLQRPDLAGGAERLPHAWLIHPNASSNVAAHWVRSATVSSIRVRGGSRTG